VSRIFTFIGVSTGGSSIMRVFPRWRDALGLGDDVEIEGWDLPIGAPGSVYRDAVSRLAADPANLGALVTTHKLAVMDAAHNLFDELDEDARLLEEISCISKRGARLLGSAKDPVSAAGAFEEIVGERGLADGAHALVMGAGGAGAAIAAYLAARRERTLERVIVTDVDAERLEHIRVIAGRLGNPPALETQRVDGTHDELLAALPPGSVVVNATGMGKDRPGSPITGDASFPSGGVVWELNYRGERRFLAQARAQEDERGLLVADGWGYFIRGWAAVIEDVFERPISAGDLAVLSREAEAATSGRSG
jgi:shikimate 5-dehydrogenase